jgi:hypothetical protein
MHAYIHACIHTYIHTGVLLRGECLPLLHSYTNTHIYTYIYIMFVCVHIYTYIQLLCLCRNFGHVPHAYAYILTYTVIYTNDICIHIYSCRSCFGGNSSHSRALDSWWNHPHAAGCLLQHYRGMIWCSSRVWARVVCYAHIWAYMCTHMSVCVCTYMSVGVFVGTHSNLWRDSTYVMRVVCVCVCVCVCL